MGLYLPNNRLPTNRQVLASYFTISPVRAGFSNSENGCLDVTLHWISCNVYTVSCNVHIQWQEKVYKQNLMEQSKVIGILRRSQKQNKVKPFIQDKITYKLNMELTLQHQISRWKKERKTAKVVGISEMNNDVEFFKNQLTGKKGFQLSTIHLYFCISKNLQTSWSQWGR